MLLLYLMWGKGDLLWKMNLVLVKPPNVCPWIYVNTSVYIIELKYLCKIRQCSNLVVALCFLCTFHLWNFSLFNTITYKNLNCKITSVFGQLEISCHEILTLFSSRLDSDRVIIGFRSSFLEKLNFLVKYFGFEFCLKHIRRYIDIFTGTNPMKCTPVFEIF